HRRWTWAAADFSDIARIRERFGGTVNDVVLAAITRGFRDLLIERHELDHRRMVRTLVPVSIRTADEHGNLDNRVAAMFADLPVGVADPVHRLVSVQDELSRLKHSGERSATEMLVALSGWAPPVALGLGMRAATRFAQNVGQRAVNTVTTNVPGPPVPLYLLGRRMLEAYPFVPIGEGVRIGVAIFTYEGRVAFGLTGDYNTTPDLGVLASGIEDGVLELVQAAEHRPLAETPADDDPQQHEEVTA
ncbi:MAG: WS/DGAT domain-containing protein, partial [Nitriliruptorales bacterium]|nr:WS/DGAT domain-containing protein [Nitriliruptorales bacterium]